jgi:2-polyprenyl-6-methoxyphenol hydroxylase-like FAD-dependent oxidoreductase
MSDDTDWDDEVDLLVLGTGAGGLAAAVTAANEGLTTLVLEKTEFLGGTTAYSAGTCWMAGNRFLKDDGDVAEARGLPRPGTRGDRLPGPDRDPVPALEDGRRLPPGDPRRRCRSRTRAADLRRPDAGT